MAAVHFENLLFLLFILVAFLFQVLTRAATKAGKGPGETKSRPTTTPPPIPRAQGETDEERIRKFLEALGQPPTSTPPPPVVHRTDIPPRPVAPIQPPRQMGGIPLPRRAAPPPKKIQLPRRITEPPYEKKVFRPQAPPSVFEVHETPAAVEPPPPPVATPAAAYAMATQPEVVRREDKIDLLSLLRSPSGLRGAIILREIFGPPRSMQSLEL